MHAPPASIAAARLAIAAEQRADTQPARRLDAVLPDTKVRLGLNRYHRRRTIYGNTWRESQ